MKTDTGLIEEAGCNDQNNYICEMPASVTSTFYIIHIKKVKLSIYCTNRLCSIWEPWTTLIYLANHLFIRQQPHKTLYENYCFSSKIGRNVHYVFPLKLSKSIKVYQIFVNSLHVRKAPLLGLSKSYMFTPLPQTLR